MLEKDNPLPTREAIWVLLVGVGVRASFYFMGPAWDPLFGWPTNDEGYYLRNAVRMAEALIASDTWQLPFWLPPGCTLIYAGLITLGFTVKGMILLQHAIGLLNTLLVFVIGRTMFPSAAPWRAAGAALLFTLCPPVLYYETKLLKPVWSLLFLLGALWLLARGPTRSRSAGSGLLLAALTLVESSFVLFVPIWAWRMRRHATALLVVYAACLAPVIWANSRAAERPMFVSANGGINLFLGNNPAWIDTFNMIPGWRWSALVNKYEVPSHEASPRFAREVLTYVQEDPVGFASGIGAKTVLTLSSGELPRDNGIPCPAALLPWSHALNALAVAGLALLAWRAGDRASRTLLMLGLLVVAINVVFFPTSRYRLPLLPLAFVGLLHAPWNRTTGVIVLLSAAGSFAANIPAARWVKHEDWAAFQEKETGLRLMAQGRHEEAGGRFEASVARTQLLENIHILAHYRHDVQGDSEAALNLFRDCIRIEPKCPEPYFFAAMILLKKGRATDTIDLLDRYLDARHARAYGNEVDPETLVAALFHRAMLTGPSNSAFFEPGQLGKLRRHIASRTAPPPAREELLHRLDEIEKRMPRAPGTTSQAQHPPVAE